MKFKLGDRVRLRGIPGPVMLASRVIDDADGAEPAGIETVWSVQGSIQRAFFPEELLELAPEDPPAEK